MKPNFSKCLACLVLVFLLRDSALQADPPGLARVQSRLGEISRAFPGKIGLYARNLDTGQELAINPDDRFPMASCYKIPIMVQVFRDAEAGKFKLEDRVEIRPDGKNPGSGLLKFTTPGLTPTIRDLVLFMITISDNFATDTLLDKVGAERVNATLGELGIKGLSVNRPTRELIRDWLAQPDERFLADPRDQSTPRAMSNLLAKIYDGTAASKDSCQQMITILRQQQFNGRIPRYLGETPVAHKTGTIGFSTNDAGILYTGKKSHVVLSIFTLKKEVRISTNVAEEAIGQLALAINDYFIYVEPEQKTE